jgi:hypothetical protein
LGHPRNVQAGGQDRILARCKDLPTERRAVAEGEITIKTCSQRQRGRKCRRTLVSAYAVRAVAVVEGYEVLCRDPA